MKAKRDRLKPRSRNLAGDFKTLVAGLERRFDGMCSKASHSLSLRNTTTTMGKCWVNVGHKTSLCGGSKNDWRFSRLFGITSGYVV